MSERQLMEEFNSNHPIGTRVRYWPGAREGEGREGRTSSEARLLSGHTAVVFIDNFSGGVALSHVEVIHA